MGFSFGTAWKTQNGGRTNTYIEKGEVVEKKHPSLNSPGEKKASNSSWET